MLLQFQILGTLMAVCRSILLSITRLITSATPEKMREPPGVPRTRKGDPSGFRTTVGLMELRGFLPGSILLTLSESVEKSSIWLFIMKP